MHVQEYPANVSVDMDTFSCIYKWIPFTCIWIHIQIFMNSMYPERGSDTAEKLKYTDTF